MTYIVPPYLIIVRKLDETNDIKPPIHFARNIYLWPIRVQRIRLDA